MRNLLQYPITEEEILAELEQIKKDYIDSQCIGGLRGVIMDILIERVRAASTFDSARFS